MRHASKTERKKDNPGELCSSYERKITQVNQQPTKS